MLRRGAVCLSFLLAGPAAGPAAPASDAPMTCAILDRPADGGTVLLEAVLEAGTDAVDGRYQFSIRSVGKAGQSVSLQSGQFRAAPGERKSLGIVTVSAVDMAVEARLVVQSAAGVECAVQY